jgi:PAS domain S-box-containing protein
LADRPETIDEALRRIEALSQELRAVAAERDEYRLVFDRAPLLVWYKDDKNNVLRANDPAAATVGLTPDEIVGRSTYDLYPEEAEAYYRDDLEVIRSGQPKLGIIEPLETTEGKRWVQTDKIPWYSPSGKAGGVVVFVSDITDRIRTQEELYRAQRLEAMGVLAGGIAHDFNNLLTAIYGNIELLRIELGVSDEAEDPAPAAPAARYVRRAMSSLGRARALTQQLLTFATGGQPGRRPVDMALLIEDVVALALSGSSVGCDVIVEPDLVPCVGDRDQIAQVLENLILNAAQSIHEAESLAQPGTPRAAGLCRISARLRTDPLPTHRGSWIEVAVQDNGAGIRDDHLQKVFDPFFTTKAEGSGLGLASAYSIVRRHEGLLDCWNNPDGGVTFRLLMPVAETGDEVPPANENEIVSSLRPLRVLLLDDDEAIRHLVQTAGPHLGLEVQCVGDLPRALAACRRAIESGRPYDVAVIDLTLRGGTGGKDALTQLRVLQPGLPSVVCSGYSKDPVLTRYDEYGFDAAVAKPYLLDELRTALVEATSRG